MHDHVGHLSVLLDDDAEGAQKILIKVRPPVFATPDNCKFAAGRESRTKLSKDLFRQHILPVGRELNLDTRSESERNLPGITRPSESLSECWCALNHGFIPSVQVATSVDFSQRQGKSSDDTQLGKG